MGKPKKKTSSRRTGNRRSHLVLRLAKAVNKRSPVRVRTTAKQSTKVKPVATKKPAAKMTAAKPAKKPATKKTAAKKKPSKKA